MNKFGLSAEKVIESVGKFLFREKTTLLGNLFHSFNHATQNQIKLQLHKKKKHQRRNVFFEKVSATYGTCKTTFNRNQILYRPKSIIVKLSTQFANELLKTTPTSMSHARNMYAAYWQKVNMKYLQTCSNKLVEKPAGQFFVDSYLSSLTKLKLQKVVG